MEVFVKIHKISKSISKIHGTLRIGAGIYFNDKNGILPDK
jgi:hypothetical protein